MNCKECGKEILSKWVFELRDGSMVCFECFKKESHDMKGMAKVYTEMK